jgi:hypothetical protein
MYFCVEARRQVGLLVTLGDLAHGDSGGRVAFLKGARLERSLECRRREEKNGLLLQAYAYVSPRADGLSRQRGQVFASGTSAMFLGATMRPKNHRDNRRVGDSYSSIPAVQRPVRTCER